MKVGTDGVLLGAWANAPQPTRLLDIGTGTGLIALMLAQRFPTAHIHAIELDLEASREAQHNFDASPWSARLELFHGNVLDWQVPIQYDLIVSNPPYFKSSLKPPKVNRTNARHQERLNLEHLFCLASQWSTAEGRLNLILPFNGASNINGLALQMGWHVDQRVLIHPFPEASQPKRVLLRFQKASCVSGESRLDLHESVKVRNSTGHRPYSPQFIELTRAFYLDH